jgi:hypothetical protein
MLFKRAQAQSAHAFKTSSLKSGTWNSTEAGTDKHPAANIHLPEG